MAQWKLKDGVLNTLSGFGGANDPETYQTYVAGIENIKEYEDLYEYNWLAERIIDGIPEEMTKNGRKINFNKAKEFRLIEDKLDAYTVISDALSKARLYGNAFIVIRTTDKLSAELTSDSKIVKLSAIPASSVVINYIKDTDDVASYTVKHNGQEIKVHISKMIPVNTVDQFNAKHKLVLKNLRDAILRYETLQKTVAIQTKEASITVFKSAKLLAKIQDKGTTAVKATYSLMGAQKSMLNGLVVDGEDEVVRLNSPLDHLKTPQEIIQDDICGGSGYPKVLLFGTQKTGLGNNNDGELKMFYGMIKKEQERKLRPIHKRLDSAILLTEFDDSEGFEFEFNPLFVTTDKEAAETKKLNAESDAINRQLGIPGEVIAKGLQQSGTYPALTDEIVGNLKDPPVDYSQTNA